MRIEFNGTVLDLPESVDLEVFLFRNHRDPGKLFIEYNERIVARDTWPSIRLRDGDKIVALAIVGGG